LAEGWHGKPFACNQLGSAAKGDWLLFLDADTRLHQGAAEAMLLAARKHNVTFLSCWPAILTGSFWEYIFMPMLNFVVYSIFPTPMQHKSTSPSFGLAHGACLLIERKTYCDAGGHALVKDELFEDTVLARAWRELGNKGICLNGRHIVSVRMYQSLGEIIRGFSKIVPCGLPPALPITAAALVLAARLIQCIQFGYRPWSAFFHPLATAGMIALGLYVRYQCRNRSGVSWKGRTYTPVQT
jgi:chlorobactene glucosyltransferase